MDSNLLHSLLAHTGNLRPTQGSSNAELHDLRRAIAASLRGGQVDAEIGTAASPQIVSASVREDLEYLAAQAPDLSQRIRVARRELGAGGMQTAEWAAGMVAAQTLGPFLDDFGRPLWFDLFLLPQAFRVLRGNEPLLVVPIGTSKNPNEPLLVVPAGTVWIRGNQLTSGVPANAWVGMRVKGGTIRIPQGTTLTDNELTIHVAALLNLRIELDPPALAGPASGPGSEATHAQATLPTEAAFAFGPLGVESIETGSASLSVYGNDVTLTRNVSHVVFEPILRMVLIPMDADRDSLEVGSVHSTLFAPRGAAAIEMAAWGISVAMTAPENLGSAVGAGSLVLATESGLLGSWPGLLAGEAVLGETLLAVDHSTLTLLARSATYFHGQQVFELWEESNGAPSMIEVQFLRPFLLALVSSRHGSDSLVFGAQLLGHLDRPLRVDGSRFPIDLHGSVVCLETASETRLGIEASTQPAGFLPMAIALSNALVTITRPTRLSVHGTLEAGVRVDKAMLVLESNVYQVLPTLPDPYAANFEPLLTQDAPVGGASLRATVTWPDAQHPALEILLDTPDGVQQLLPQPNRLARDPSDPRGVASGSLYWLLDVSSCADQLGLSLSIPTGAEVPPEARRLEIGNFSLQFPGNQMYTMLLPQFQWEAVYNTRNSRTGDQDGWLQPSVEGVGPSDGGPSFVRSQTAQLIPLAPTPVAVEMVRAYTHDNAPSGAVFTLPFGMTARAALQDERYTVPPGLRLLNIRFDGLTSGRQISLTAGVETSFEVEGNVILLRRGPLLSGSAFQTRNFVGSNRDNALGPLRTSFNNTFTSRVPIQRIDFSGYGASIFSRWIPAGNPDVGITQVGFDAFNGRTAFERVQMVTLLWPCLGRLVRTIVLQRQGGGSVVRWDSGWLSTTPGLFFRPDFQAIHKCVVEGMYDIREIRDTDQIIELAGATVQTTSAFVLHRWGSKTTVSARQKP